MLAPMLARVLVAGDHGVRRGWHHQITAPEDRTRRQGESHLRMMDFKQVGNRIPWHAISIANLLDRHASSLESSDGFSPQAINIDG